MTPASAPIHIHILACLALGAVVTFVLWCLCGAVAHEKQMTELEDYQPQPKERIGGLDRPRMDNAGRDLL